ncbi:MAG TPA: hypothetical protein VGH19_16125 [Verrucomicrobiae bacterium]
MIPLMGAMGGGGTSLQGGQAKSGNENEQTTKQEIAGRMESGAGNRGPVITIGDGNKVDASSSNIPVLVGALAIGGVVIFFLLRKL